MNSRRDTIFHVLDLPLDSSPRIVRKKCQDLLLKYHPDKNLGQESEEYHKVSEAWKQISNCEDLTVLLNQEKARGTNITNTNPVSRFDDLKVSDLRLEEIEFDGSQISARVCDCRCGGVYVLTQDTIEESQFVDKWTVECDTCSLIIRVSR